MPTKIVNGVRRELTAEEVAARQAEIDSYVEPIPASVTKRQARQQLIIMGLLGDVQPLIDAIVDNTQRDLTQSFWDDSNIYERDRPELISLALGLGLNDEALDAAFIAANKL